MGDRNWSHSSYINGIAEFILITRRASLSRGTAPDKYVKMASNSAVGRGVVAQRARWRRIHGDKVYIRADDVCFSFVVRARSLFLFSFCTWWSARSVALPWKYLETGRSWHFYPVHLPYEDVSGKNISSKNISRNLSFRRRGTSNGHAPKLCDTFNFIYIAAEDTHLRDDARYFRYVRDIFNLCEIKFNSNIFLSFFRKTY